MHRKIEHCDGFSSDKVFEQFKVIEFPVTFVGLTSTLQLYIDLNLNDTAYLKTSCQDKLMNLEEARQISASHKAFETNQIDEHTLKICFKPTNECISKAKNSKSFSDTFVFDIRLIEATHIRCCSNEHHAEIGRYYICGKYEYCQITHYPKIIDFGHLLVNNKETKVLLLRNNSSNVNCKLNYSKVTGFEVTPSKFTLSPNSKKRIHISLKLTSLQLGNFITFNISNENDAIDDKDTGDSTKNYIIYKIYTKCKIQFPVSTKVKDVPSMHKLYEKDARYTYIGQQLSNNIKKNEIALHFLDVCKKTHVKLPDPEKVLRKDDKKYCCDLNVIQNPLSRNFCDIIRSIIPIYELFDIILHPYLLDFGRVALSTSGEQQLKIKNNSIYEVHIHFLQDNCITYTEKMKSTFTFKVEPFSENFLKIYCLSYIVGSYRGTFIYSIENKYYIQHPYILQVGNPTLMLKEKCLKFGMVNMEMFVTNVPITIVNHFNRPVEFDWEGLDSDVPFEIIPRQGTIPIHSSRMCDVQYLCKPTKSKTHEVEFVSCGHAKKIVPLELNILTRKHAIKFLQVAVFFKDIPLNLEVSEKVKLENSSKEFAVFHVVEPLIPGCTVEPMHGIIKPKMVISMEIKIKITCILEFTFDVCVKINNKDTILLPVSGNIVEPKITIHPRNIYLTRIPCFMVSYVPVVFQNTSSAKALVRVLETGDDNIFKVYVNNGNEKIKISEFYLEPSESRTVYIKVFDIFRREYDMYLPFQINDLLGPPDKNAWTTDLQFYINKFEKVYENNLKIKLKRINRDISYCRIIGVITLPWIEFCPDTFEFVTMTGMDSMEFTMTNISKYILPVTIATSKLAPNFTLKLLSEEYEFLHDANIKFELTSRSSVTLSLKFHPKRNGQFVAVAVFYLDKHLSTPYHNLTFYGKNELPILRSSTYKLIFPPSDIDVKMIRYIDLYIDVITEKGYFDYETNDDNVTVNFGAVRTSEIKDKTNTIITTQICIHSKEAYVGKTTITFFHKNKTECEIEICYCYTYCPITLHANSFVHENHPYPYYPSKQDTDLYSYMNTCKHFLEKWLFQQGFRRDFFPSIPNSFHNISSALTSQQGGGPTKPKGINVSYLNFIRRIAGPLMKHTQKIPTTDAEDNFKEVLEIHNSYKEIINLLKIRGANIWTLEAKYLLSYEQFKIYCENVFENTQAGVETRTMLLNNMENFKRFNKQCWIDFILQTYKVFVVDSCFFECLCVSTQHRDIVKILTDWFTKQIESQYHFLLKKDKSNPTKTIKNITTDLSDGVAIASAILNHCPFMKDHFSIFYEVDENHSQASMVHNTSLIIEAMNQLKLYFPLNSTDLLQPNFLQMLFLAVHLYIVLPLFRTKETIKFNPPLSRSSSRQVSIYPSSQESLVFNNVIINNVNNAFSIEKTAPPDNIKKSFISIKYQANFIDELNSILIVQGYNKTRLFDTYLVFYLRGNVGSLLPHKKCKVVCPLYRPNKSDILVSSPFYDIADYNIYIFDEEPTVPLHFDNGSKSKFFVRRVHLIDDTLLLRGIPKEANTQEIFEQKLSLYITCLSTQVGNTWIWFKSDIGEFFIKVTTQPRWDLALDMLQARMTTWPLRTCNCGEACECYRTTVLLIPHKNELMVRCLRIALCENASDVMMKVFDQLIDSVTGKLILAMLLEESGTDMTEVSHILKNEAEYRITSRTLEPRVDHITLSQHSDAILKLPITIPIPEKSDKYTITLTSECGMDVRTYRVLFFEDHVECEYE